MLPSELKARQNLFLFGILVLLVALLGIYISVQGSLGARDSSADTSSGEYTYVADQFKFSANGKLANINQYVALPAAPAYTTAAFKALTEVKFSLANAPLETIAHLCVKSKSLVSGVETSLICENVNLQTSSSASWELALPFGLLVEPDKQYYCQVDLSLFSQEGINQLAATATQASCQLDFVALDAVDKVALSFNAGLLADIGQGSALIAEGIKFSLSKDTELLGAYAAVAADPTLVEQGIANICIITDSRNCLAAYSFNNNVDGHYSAGYLDLSKQLKQGQSVEFSCTTQSGRWGACEVFAFLAVPAADLDNLSSSLTRSDYYSLDSSFVSRYCVENSFYYQNSLQLLHIPAAKKVERCQAILSGSDY